MKYTLEIFQQFVKAMKHIFKRRGKKQQVTKAINKSLLCKLDKGMGP
jgi:hypothetical protein